MMPDKKQQFLDAQKTDPPPGFCIPECGLLEEKLWLDSPRWKGRQAGLGVDGAFLCKGRGRVRRTLPRLGTGLLGVPCPLSRWDDPKTQGSSLRKEPKLCVWHGRLGASYPQEIPWASARNIS